MLCAVLVCPTYFTYNFFPFFAEKWPAGSPPSPWLRPVPPWCHPVPPLVPPRAPPWRHPVPPLGAPRALPPPWCHAPRCCVLCCSCPGSVCGAVAMLVLCAVLVCPTYFPQNFFPFFCREMAGSARPPPPPWRHPLPPFCCHPIPPPFGAMLRGAVCCAVAVLVLYVVA